MAPRARPRAADSAELDTAWPRRMGIGITHWPRSRARRRRVGHVAQQTPVEQLSSPVRRGEVAEDLGDHLGVEDESDDLLWAQHLQVRGSASSIHRISSPGSVEPAPLGSAGQDGRAAPLSLATKDAPPDGGFSQSSRHHSSRHRTGIQRRTAVIIGASSGIGEALAHELNRAGWHLGLLACRLDRLEPFGKHSRRKRSCAAST